MTDSKATPAELLTIAQQLASEAGELVRTGRATAQVTAVKSASTDIVTQMDQAAETLILRRLKELRPDDSVLGEEGAAVVGQSGITWIVDPIDGTVNYLYGIEHYGVSIAAVAGPPVPGKWRPLAGAVFEGDGTLWSAAAGLGAWRDGVPIAIRTQGPDLAHTLLATGFQYQASVRTAQAEVVSKLIGQVRDIRRIGAASLDLCRVAAGELDAYYEHGLNPWDYAAGELICLEAGIRVGGVGGGAASPELLVAAVPSVWEDLHGAIEQAGGMTLLDTPTA